MPHKPAARNFAVRAILYIALLVGGVAAVALTLYNGHREAQLLRADPDAIPGNRPLMQFAATRGAAKFRSHCASCHARAGNGDAGRGVPDLTDRNWLFGSGTVSEIERVVAYVIRSNNPKAWNLARMPGFARAQPSPTDANIVPLSPGNIRDVIEYLISLQRGSANAAAASRGAQVYFGVGGCYDCHSPDGKGDSAIGAPNLVDNVTLYGNGSREALFESIANGRQGVCPAFINRLHPAAIREVALYVYLLSHPHG
jgi:cytochrome c oxidase cbb3-type subunit 3